jgi:uncharacterized membrane protein
MREFMLIIHFIGIAMGVGTSFAFMFLAMAGKKMETGEGQKFMINAFTLTRMGQIGLVLLLISGGYLMTPFWSSLGSNSLLMVKLIMFLFLAGLIGMISAHARKAKLGNTEKHLKRIEPMGKMALITGLTIIVLAVLIFK